MLLTYIVTAHPVSDIWKMLVRVWRNNYTNVSAILLKKYFVVAMQDISGKRLSLDIRSIAIIDSEMKIFDYAVPRTEAIAEIASEGVSIFKYDVHNKGAESYGRLAQEVVANA